MWDLTVLDGELRLLREQIERQFGGAPAAYTLEAAARQLSVSTKTVRRMMASGQLLPVTLGRRKLIPRSEIERVTTPAAPRAAAARRVARVDSRAERQRLKELLKAKRRR
jgi:excisionase family DNA binding protein